MTAKAVTIASLFCTLICPAKGFCKDPPTALEQLILDKHNELRARHVDTEPLCFGLSNPGDDFTFSTQERVSGWTPTGTFDVDIGESHASDTLKNFRTQTDAYERVPRLMWYSKGYHWDYTTSTKSISSPETHIHEFTNIIWRSTKEVDCKYRDAPPNFILLCQYYPPGNEEDPEAAAANVGRLKGVCERPEVTIENAILEPDAVTLMEGTSFTLKCRNGVVKLLTCGSDGNLTPAGPISCKVDQKKTCDKPMVKNAILEPNTVEEGESYTVKCLSFGVETFLTCGADGNLTPSSVTCDEMSGAGKLAMSAVLVAGAAALFL